MSSGKSSDEKSKIVGFIISHSPAGELKYVYEDLKKLLGNDVSNEAYSKYIFRFFEENSFLINTKKGKNVVITNQSVMENGEYMDFVQGTSFKIDPIKQIVKSSSKKENGLPAEVEKCRKAISEKVMKYAEECYVDGKFGFSVAAKPNGDIFIVISAINSNIKNFWTGTWITEYRLNVLDKEEKNMSSKVKIDVHYFEDGNVKFETIHNNEIYILTKSIEELCNSIIDGMRTNEQNLKIELDEFLLGLESSAFRALRRFLPVTRTKMNWSLAQSLAGTLK